MIQKLRITNFRNFSEKEISFSSGVNIIIGKNGYGKSNILEALSLPSSPFVESHPNYLVEQGKDVFFIQYTLDTGVGSISYNIKTHRKKYMREGNPSSKPVFQNFYPHIVSFHPMIMNLMYLIPSERRNFLDEILISSFSQYKNLLQEYKKVLLNRNKLLKNISEGKSNISELTFWNNSYLDTAEKIYSYRREICLFFMNSISQLKKYFFGKIDTIQFLYISKTPLKNTRQYLEEYISNNIQKEILLRKTLRGPHLDDFDIIIDNVPLIHFASRGEVKSIILGLKFLETQFIEKNSAKKNILFLIDDLLSELDTKHRSLLWEHIGSRQSIVTSVEDLGLLGNKIYLNT